MRLRLRGPEAAALARQKQPDGDAPRGRYRGLKATVLAFGHAKLDDSEEARQDLAGMGASVETRQPFDGPDTGGLRLAREPAHLHPFQHAGQQGCGWR